MEDGVTFDIIDHVGSCLERYPESLMKIRYDLAEKKVNPRVVWRVGRVGWLVIVKFKDWLSRSTSWGYSVICKNNEPQLIL